MGAGLEVAQHPPIRNLRGVIGCGGQHILDQGVRLCHGAARLRTALVAGRVAGVEHMVANVAESLPELLILAARRGPHFPPLALQAFHQLHLFRHWAIRFHRGPRLLDDGLLGGDVALPIPLDVLMQRIRHRLEAGVELLAGGAVHGMVGAPLLPRRAQDLRDALVVRVLPVVAFQEGLQFPADGLALGEIETARLGKRLKVLPTGREGALRGGVEAFHQHPVFPGADAPERLHTLAQRLDALRLLRRWQRVVRQRLHIVAQRFALAALRERLPSVELLQTPGAARQMARRPVLGGFGQPPDQAAGLPLLARCLGDFASLHMGFHRFDAVFDFLLERPEHGLTAFVHGRQRLALGGQVGEPSRRWRFSGPSHGLDDGRGLPRGAATSALGAPQGRKVLVLVGFLPGRVEGEDGGRGATPRIGALQRCQNVAQALGERLMGLSGRWRRGRNCRRLAPTPFDVRQALCHGGAVFEIVQGTEQIAFEGSELGQQLLEGCRRRCRLRRRCVR